MSLIVRKAEARDASFLAWVMLTASRSHCRYGLWEHFVGGNEQDCLAFLEKLSTTKTLHLFHYTAFLIAEKENLPVAGLSGYDPAIAGMKSFGSALAEISVEIGWSRKEIKSAYQRLSSYAACKPDERPGVWIVESVAARPEVRRQGIMQLLLQEIIAQGRNKGFEQAQISVLISNTAARRAYEKSGFNYMNEKRSPDFEATYGDFGIARLRLNLKC